MEVKDYRKYLLFALVVLLLVISALIIKPFFISMLTAIILGYIFYPVYRWGCKKVVKNKALMAAITLIIIILVVTIPSFMIINKISKEIQVAYLLGKQGLVKMTSPNIQICPENTAFCNSINSIKVWLSGSSVQYHLRNSFDRISTFFNDMVSKFIMDLPKIIISIFLIMFIIYFILKDGEKFAKEIKELMPISIKHKEKIIRKFNSIISSTIYGGFVVGVLQGIVATIGYVLIGVNTPLMWGLLSIVAALIPFIGPSIIYIPLSLIRIINGVINADKTFIITGVILLLYGIFVVSMVDNILRPKIIGDRAQMHPVAVLVGIFGGIPLFGAIGIIAGPLILGMLIETIVIYKEETKNVIQSKAD